MALEPNLNSRVSAYFSTPLLFLPFFPRSVSPRPIFFSPLPPLSPSLSLFTPFSHLLLQPRPLLNDNKKTEYEALKVKHEALQRQYQRLVMQKGGEPPTLEPVRDIAAPPLHSVALLKPFAGLDGPAVPYTTDPPLQWKQRFVIY